MATDDDDEEKNVIENVNIKEYRPIRFKLFYTVTIGQG